MQHKQAQYRVPMKMNYMTKQDFIWRHMPLCGVCTHLCVIGFR